MKANLLAWIDAKYRLVMLGLMLLEITLLGVLVFVEVFRH
jgi:hypothetical protein